MFWADTLAQKTIKNRKKERYLVCDYKTPSGKIHVGALRGVVLHEIARMAINSLGKQAVFQYGFDDFDPMDDVPKYLPKSFARYLGQPVFMIPPPPGSKKKNFAHEYAEDFAQVIEGLGIKPKIIWMSEMYQSGFLDEAIRISLNKAQTIRNLYKKIANQDLSSDWLPIQMVCEKCKRLGTTRPISWDKQKQTVSYYCAPDWVSYSRGCGFRGENSPYGGNAKMPYKVEWAGKWHLFATDIEGGGKDHQTKGGARQLSVAIFKALYKGEAPENIFYEFFLTGGKKMSSSKALGVSAHDISNLLPVQLLRFLMTVSPPQRQIDFSPEGGTIPQLYNRFDSALDEYWRDASSLIGRVIYYSYPNKRLIPRYTMGFSKVMTISQLPHVSTIKVAQREKGSLLSSAERADLSSRVKFARRYLANFAPPELKFEIQKILPRGLKLTKIQGDFLRLLLAFLEQPAKLTGEELHSEIHNIKNQLEIAPSSAFGAIYMIFLNRQTGPQAGFFLASLPRDFVLKRLKQAIKKIGD